MDRKPCEWLAAPDEEDDVKSSELSFRLAEEWIAVDSDQLILPIVVLDKTGMNVTEPYQALLKQYGGEGLLNDMLMSDQEVEAGSEWLLLRTESLLTIEPRPD